MYKEKIEAYFEKHKDEYLEVLSNLIKIPSERGDEEEGKPFGKGTAEALDYAVSIAEGYGLAAHNHDNYVATVELGIEDTIGVDVLAHLDVVPAGDGWTETNAFTPTIKEHPVYGHVIYGRGSQDDKGPAVAALFAIRAIKDMKIPLRKNARLILGANEEYGGTDIDYFFEQNSHAPYAFSPDAYYPVINEEKGRIEGHIRGSYNTGKLVSFHSGEKSNVVPSKAIAILKGVLLEDVKKACEKFGAGRLDNKTCSVKFNITEKTGFITVEAEGINAHASMPELGLNAATALIEVLSGLELGDDTVKSLNRMFPHGDLNGKTLGARDKAGKLCEDFTLSLSIVDMENGQLELCFDGRLPASLNMSTLEKIEEMAKSFGFEYENTISLIHYIPESSILVQTLLNSYETYSGEKGYCTSMGGGTYCHSIENGVAFGCARECIDNHIHGANEFAIVDDLIMSAKIFTSAIIELCK